MTMNEIDECAGRLIEALRAADWIESDDPQAFVTSTPHFGVTVQMRNGWTGVRFESSAFSSTGLAHMMTRLHIEARESAARSSQ